MAGAHNVVFESALVHPPNSAEIVCGIDGVEILISFDLKLGELENLGEIQICKKDSPKRGLRANELLVLDGATHQIKRHILEHYLLKYGVSFGEALKMITLKKCAVT